MFVSMKSWTSLKMGHNESKTRSLGQILEKPCVCSRGHIFIVLMKSWKRLKIGHVGSKTRSLDQIFEKACVSSRDLFLAHLSTTCSMGAFRVVRCPSCVVNNFFKHLLLPNRWANVDQTLQECSLGGPLQTLFTEFDSIKNSGCHGNEIEFFK